MVYGFYQWYDKVKRYFTFKKEEILGIIITTLILGFMFGIDDGRKVASGIDFYWVQHLIGVILIVGLAVIVHVSVQKAYALKLGFKAEYKPWIYGLLLALILVIVTRGSLILVLPGFIVLEMMPFHRIGYFRYGTNVWTYGWIGMAGPVANLLLALFFRLLFEWYPDNVLLRSAVIINVMFAIFTALPIPPLDGSRMFFAWPTLYFFFLGSVIGVSVLILLTMPSIFGLLFWSLIAGIVLMIVFNLIFYKLMDTK